MSFIVEAILTSTLGCLKVIGDTSMEYTIFSVSLTKPALAVSKSRAGVPSFLSCSCFPTI